MKLMSTLLLSLVMVIPMAFAGSGSSGSSATQEEKVLALLHLASKGEVEVGKLAVTKAESQDVRDFAALLVKDHSASDEQALALAETLHADLDHLIQADSPMQQAMQEHQALVAKLEALSGAEFDHEFAAAMYAGHVKVIEKLEAARASLSDDSSVAALLDELFPILRQHRDTAQRLAEG